jgi:hypothetical protein
MKIASEKPAFARVTRREGLLSLLGGALFLAGCGGGGDSSQASVNSGGTGSTDASGSLSVGPIAGMGSIIVNGVRFDDTTAKVLDDDADVVASRGDLKLGMMCRVKGKAKSRKADKTDEAEEITFRSDLLGPVDSVPLTTSAPTTMVVLGQKVQITITTIFEDGLSLDKLAANDIVEVHGFVDPLSHEITATRIERKVLANVKFFKLQGKISKLATTSFQIGSLVIGFDSAARGNLTLANDLLVRVRLDKVALTPVTPVAPPAPAASAASAPASAASAPVAPVSTVPAVATRKAIRIRAVEVESEDHDEVEVKGLITVVTSTADFTVNGVKIDASGVAGLATLKVGSRVEVEGRMVKGVLLAKKVELENEDDDFKFVLHGKVSGNSKVGTTVAFTLTSTGGMVAKVTFKVGEVKFVNLTSEASLKDGLTLKVEGRVSPDGTFVAKRITLE